MRLSLAVAGWLLERLGLDSALAGDLLEECAHGRSTAWYWRQVLVAMWTAISGAILHHKLLASRALATGCAVNAMWTFLWMNFLHVGLGSIPTVSFESIATLLALLLTQAATGWIVARTHRAHPVPMVLVFALWLVTWYFIGSLPDARRLLVNSIDQPRFRPYLAWFLTPISIEVIGLLFGAVAAARPPRHASRPNAGTL